MDGMRDPHLKKWFSKHAANYHIVQQSRARVPS